MEKGRRWTLATGCAVVLIGAGWVQATTEVVLDNFNTGLGHFDRAPTFSGSNRRVAGTSTSARVTTDGPLEGAGHLRLSFVVGAPAADNFRCRFVSGGASPAGNVPIITSGAQDGWIGFYLKTTQTNLTVSLWIEGPSNNFGSRKAIIPDGQWHLYEWNLDDNSGGPDGWGDSTNGILTNSPTVADGSHTIDSIIFRTDQLPDFAEGLVMQPIYLDFVAVNPAGSVDLLINKPCRNTPDVGGVRGPVQAGDTSVVVTGCSTALSEANGDAVYVYADGVKIGELTSGFDTTNGTNTVPLFSSPSQVVLVKGQRLTATQKINNQEGCLPDPLLGPVVGSGNSPVKLTLSVRDLAGLNGPLGADGGTGGKLVWVGAATTVGGSPQGLPFAPSVCWQTFEFRPLTDPRLNFAGTGDGTSNLNNLPWGEIEHLAVAIDTDAPNTGPYTIYIDDVENGSEGLMTGFEEGESQAVALNQVNVLFSQPSFSGTTAGNLLANPNVSVVTDEQAYNGSRSLKVQFQFKSENTSSWVRLTAATNNNHPYQNPMIRLDQPVRMRLLMLPVGETVAAELDITSQPVDIVGKCVGESATFSVTAQGTNAISYQWLRSPDGVAAFAPIDGATGSSYTFTVAADDATARYRVEVKDTVTGCTVQSNSVGVALTPVITQHPSPVFTCPGGSAVFTAAGIAPNATYLWKENGVPLSSGNGVSGVNTPTLTINPVDASRHGKVYTAEIGNGCTPATTVTTSGAMLTVHSTPGGITGTPASGLATLGSPASVSVGGFLAQYFDIAPATAPPFPADALPTLMRLDPLVNTDWVTGGPAANITADGFLARWQAKVIAPFSENYTFYTRSDDGVRLWVNGVLVIDKWVNQGSTEWCGPGTTAPGTCTQVPLTAGQVVDIRMEYYENTGNAIATLSWSSPSLPKQFLSPLAVKWRKDGQLLAASATEIKFAAVSGADTGSYTAEFVDPCSGATVVTPPFVLDIWADYTGDGQVTIDDVVAFNNCATGPNVPFTPADPCKPAMDADGDGDVDGNDFGAVQRQIGRTQ
ncbi:MAG: hypothetical protein HRF43_15205 [Phycisphaerae bacterium]|jgi:hypothetical protein